MISLIITVKNEKNTLPQWLKSIKKQSQQPDEIIIVDSFSTDGTWEWLQMITSPTIKIFQREGNIAVGRNYAISQAQGDSIVVTDAGCVYQDTWLEKLVTPLKQKDAQFVATAFMPWLETSDRLLQYLLAAATCPAPNEFQKDWLPSSRSVGFSKALSQSVGGYPEWIPYCEDVIFDLKIQKKGIIPFFIREPLVAWHPRPTLLAYFRQLYNYTRSDGHGKLFYVRQFIRYGVYGGLIGVLLFVWFYSLWGLIPLILGGSFYMRKFWSRFWYFSREKKLLFRLVGMVVLPFIIAVGDVAKMSGWLVGVGERWSGKIKYESF